MPLVFLLLIVLLRMCPPRKPDDDDDDWKPRPRREPSLTSRPKRTAEDGESISPRASKQRASAQSDAPKASTRKASSAAAGGKPRAPREMQRLRLLPDENTTVYFKTSGRDANGEPLPPSRFARKHWLIRLISFGFTMAVIGLVLMVPVLMTLPDISKLAEADKKPSIVVVSQRGEPIGQFGDVMGEEVRYQQLPKHLINALVATEDRRFFNHWGVDPWGIARAMVTNVRAGHLVQGGSTITQQLAKNVYLTADRTLQRKVLEAFLAFKLEANYSKEEILGFYFNRVYLGGGNFGVAAAASRYFGKKADDLNLAESAVIAGLLKAPSRYSPLNNPELARKRGEQVLLNMVDAGLLDARGLAKGKAQMRRVFSRNTNRWARAPYFADWIADELTDYMGGLQQDVVVTTTLDGRLQRLADEAVGSVMAEAGGQMHASQAALLAMAPDGAVRAMVGGVDYAKSQFNRATQAMRQPGSSFKLFVYLAGMEAGYSPDSVLEDAPLSLKVASGTWSPSNYDGKSHGKVSLRYAFAESLNTVAVRLSEDVGREKVAEMARRLGVNIQGAVTPAIALGVTETSLYDMTTAYAHVASNGRAVAPYGIVRIELSHPEEGQDKLIYERTGSGFGQALSPTVVAKINTLLRAVISEGTGTKAQIGRPVAGKTGTSQDFRDAWFVGFIPQLTTGVWVGNDDNSPMKKSTGGNLPARIWAKFMRAAASGYEVRAMATYSKDMVDGLLPWQQPAPDAPTTELPWANQPPSNAGVGVGQGVLGVLKHEGQSAVSPDAGQLTAPASQPAPSVPMNTTPSEPVPSNAPATASTSLDAILEAAPAPSAPPAVPATVVPEVAPQPQPSATISPAAPAQQGAPLGDPFWNTLLNAEGKQPPVEDPKL